MAVASPGYGLRRESDPGVRLHGSLLLLDFEVDEGQASNGLTVCTGTRNLRDNASQSSTTTGQMSLRQEPF